MKLKEMEAPAKLTIVRLALIPLFMIFTVYNFGLKGSGIGEYTWPRIFASSLFLLACVVYIIDKQLMKKRDITKGFWGFLDVVADRLVIFSALISICFSDYILPNNFYENLFFWSTAIIIIRELVIIGICLTEASVNVDHLFDDDSKPQKWLMWITTALQMLCIIVVILEPIVLSKYGVFRDFRLLSLIITVLTVVSTVISCLYSIIAYKKYITEQECE